MELLYNCRDHAHGFYCDLLTAAENSLADVLFERAEHSSNDEEQRSLFEGMQQLENRAEKIQGRFRQTLEQSFQHFLSGQRSDSSSDDAIDAAQLSLVKREDLEDELAISVIVSKSNTRHCEQLWKLNRRLAVLRGGEAVKDETNPFAPAVVCDAVRAAIEELDVDVGIRLLVYKQLGKLLVLSFGKELKALNALLVEKGILPNLRFEVEKSADNDRPKTQRTVSPVVADNSQSDEAVGDIEHQHQLYQAIRALQSVAGPRQQTISGVSYGSLDTSGEGGADTFVPVDYALALSAIQQSRDFLYSAATNRPQSAEMVEQKLVGQLLKQGHKDSRHKMSSDDANVVDLVGLIFRYMLDDPYLPDIVKALLSHLHTPCLKLALIDNHFLEDSQHVGRQLLNLMALLGTRWVKSDGDRTVLPKLKGIVEAVLQGFIDDVSVFDTLLEDLRRFRDGLEKRAQMVEKRNAEAERGLERLELSRQHAAKKITDRLEENNIPPPIVALIQSPWADFLSFISLRHGEDSSSWRAALKVIDGVVWSVQPIGAKDGKEEFHRRQTELDQTVKEGLSAIGYDSQASQMLLKCLQEAQQLAYQGVVMDELNSSSKVSDETSKVENSQQQQVDAKPEQEVLSVDEKKMLAQLKDIAFGTWFEFQQPGGDFIALKLAWSSKVTSHCMFVDRAGVKQLVDSQLDLAKSMCSGRVRLAASVKKNLMERAMEAVFNTLKLA